MKIRSVHIDNFRAFHHDKGGDFDFTLNTNDVADFVAVYAPNGYGKTSFVDAIEWALTTEVSRFNVKHVENKRIKKIYKENRNHLRNFEDKDRPAKVNLFTLENSDQAISISDVKGISQISKFERKPFHKVSLSQEWISKFLLEDYGSDRFLLLKDDSTFEQTAVYYLGLKKIIEYYDKEKKIELEGNIKKLEDDIKKDFNPKITQTINDIVESAVFKDYKIRIPSITNINDLKPFIDSISQNLALFKSKISLIDTKIFNIKKLFETDESGKSPFSSYFFNVENLISKRVEIKQKELVALILNNRKILSELEDDITNLLWLQKNFNYFQINFKSAELRGKRQLLEKYNSSLDKWNVAEIDLKATLYEKESLEANRKKRMEFETFSSAIKTDIQSILDNSFQDISNLISSELSAILNISLEISKEGYKLQEVLNEKKLFQGIDNDLQNIIERGIQIVNKADSSSCPLCHQDYDSKDKLLNTIRSSNVIGYQLSNILEKEQIQNDRLLYLNKLLEEEKSKLIKILEEKVNIKYEQLGKPKSVEEYNQLLHNIALRINNIQITLDEKMNFLNSLSESEFIISLNREIDAINIFIHGYAKDTTIDPTFLQDTFKNEYLSKLEKLKLVSLSSERDISLKLDAKKNEQIKLELETNLFIEQVGDEYKILSKNSLDQLSIQKNELSIFILGLESNLKGIENGFKEMLDDDLVNKSQNDIDFIIETKLSDLSKEKEKLGSVLISLGALKEMVGSIESFLKIEEDKKTLNTLQNDLLKHNDVVDTKLRPEYERAKQELDCLVKANLKEELINNIYKTIDPHPDFKDVKFNLDLEASPPTLDIELKNDDRTIVPTLYFSMAQINILSLSIFLANALNSKEYDFIIIDDPIQSMDGINILATIDLFRGIIANLDKQIILTTHDFNFYSLLKKKIPRDKFKAKYFAFETFGKVAEDNK